MCGLCQVLQPGAGPRSAVELREAAMHYELAAALSSALTGKAMLGGAAAWCRSQAEAMSRVRVGCLSHWVLLLFPLLV